MLLGPCPVKFWVSPRMENVFKLESAFTPVSLLAVRGLLCLLSARLNEALRNSMCNHASTVECAVCC